MSFRFDRNQEATVWVGGLDEKVDEALLYELMLQAGPIVSVNIPRDKITHEHQGYAFCEFCSEAAADYAMKTMNMVRLFGKSIKINKASRDKKDTGVGANVFVGNLDAEVDDQLLYNTFCAFGQVLAAKVMYEDDGQSRGFGFVDFADFESSDTAILHMNGQFLCNRPVHVSYAYKKHGSNGEKHGGENERLLAKMQEKAVTRPHMHFSSSAPIINMNMIRNNNLLFGNNLVNTQAANNMQQMQTNVDRQTGNPYTPATAQAILQQQQMAMLMQQQQQQQHIVALQQRIAMVPTQPPPPPPPANTFVPNGNESVASGGSAASNNKAPPINLRPPAPPPLNNQFGVVQLPVSRPPPPMPFTGQLQPIPVPNPTTASNTTNAK